MSCLCVLFLLTSGLSGFQIANCLSHLVMKREENAILSCTRLDRTHQAMYWYRQYPGRGLELLFYAYGLQMLEKGDVKDPRFTASRPTLEKLSLEIRNLEAQDSAIYFCARRDTGAGSVQYFGDGTKLTVLEKEPQVPKVSIFHPSVDEIKKKKKATLVCVAYDFYPDHVSITWIINEDEAKEGEFKTDDYPAENNKNYSMTSRLRVSSYDFLNPQNYFQCVVSFTLKEAKYIKDGIYGRKACGMTPELYRKESNAGKFTYLLLLSKSALYGFIILMVIMWKVKASSDKNYN